MTQEVPEGIASAVRRLGLAPSDGPLVGEPLTGGVSSDVWRIDLPAGPVCAKRALPKLRVQGDWRAPTSRAEWEARWLTMAAEVLPESACGLRGFDVRNRVLVLDWLDPAGHPVWKDRLAAGVIDPGAAAEVGRRLAALHTGAASQDLASWEEARPLFASLRIDPYLRETARRHPGLAVGLESLAIELATAAVTVIHGDVSPKNILLGPDGPVLLDAECASPGDPAFDVAFCANHLLLKAVWMPRLREALVAEATELVAAYVEEAGWDLEERVTRLLPALALARVDGLSPVEYLSEQRGRPAVRRAAIDLIVAPPAGFAALAERWLDRTHSAEENT